MKFVKHTIITLVFFVLTGCGEPTVKDICQEMSDITKDRTSKGFSPAAMRGCISEGIINAKRTLKSMKN